MNKLFKTFSLLAIIAFVITVGILYVVDIARAAPAKVSYQTMLGKSIRDQDVADFIASNSCTQAGPFYLCRPAGLALWTDDNQVVKTVYLHLNNSADFAAYKGDLPFRLASSDAMTDVEQKLGQPKVDHAPQAGWEPGLPDEGYTPDHIHYWAVYKRFGVTIIYNTPVANDKNASISAILISK